MNPFLALSDSAQTPHVQTHVTVVLTVGERKLPIADTRLARQSNYMHLAAAPNGTRHETLSHKYQFYEVLLELPRSVVYPSGTLVC